MLPVIYSINIVPGQCESLGLGFFVPRRNDPGFVLLRSVVGTALEAHQTFMLIMAILILYVKHI